MQAAAYQNGLWVVAAGKAGCEEGCDMLGASCIVAPSGEVAARAAGLGDELVIHTLDREAALAYKRFHDIDANRRPECYGPITAAGAAAS
jgi:predicted amidohydrolase